MSSFVADLRYGVRMLLAAPRVTVAALFSLALGIGATTAIVTVVNAVLLRPLPYPNSDRLVAVWETSRDNDRRWVAPANFLDWRRDAPSFASLAGYAPLTVNLTGRNFPERLRVAAVSGSFFSTLAVQAAVGRTIAESDDRPGAQRVAMLTHGAWQRLSGGDPRAIGETLVLDGRVHTVVGVLPQQFHFFGADIELVTSGDRGVPTQGMLPGDITQERDVHFMSVIGRVRDGATPERAETELIAIMRRLELLHPRTNTGLGARVVPLHADLVAGSRKALLLLLGAVGFLLLIACVNVANLLLARAVARQREMGVRVALGAGRGRLVRQVLTETALLGLVGGAIGIVVGAWGVSALLTLAPDGLPRAVEIRVDATTLIVAVLVSLATAFVFGAVPALHATSPRHQRNVVDDGTRTSGSRGERRVQQALVVSELALAQVLLAGAGLLIASLVNLHDVDLGFNPERLLAVDVTLPRSRYADPQRKLAFHRAALERMEALPGVRSAAAALMMPLRGAINRGIWLADRPAPPPGQQLSTDFQIVSSEYFRTLGIPLLDGRTFTQYDTLESPRVAILSQAAARQYWPRGNAVGQRVRFGKNEAEVIGVVGDVRQRDQARDPAPLLYTSLQQDDEFWNSMTFALRVDGDPALVAAAARQAVLAVDPDQPVGRIQTVDEIADTLLAGRRFNTVLLTTFAATALLLAVIGTYGVIAYSVTLRTREIGIRMAVGARPIDVTRMVLRQGGTLVGVAVACGTLGALATNRLLANQLFAVTAGDPATLIAGAGTLGVLALAACYVPARRAMQTQPVEALRAD